MLKGRTPTEWQVAPTYLLAPPASGETMVQFFHSGMFSLIHFSTAGSAYKLSTGISKNPWKKITEIFGLGSQELNMYNLLEGPIEGSYLPLLTSKGYKSQVSNVGKNMTQN